MLNLRSSRLTVMVLAAAAVILVAGGAAIASNMGFKMNKPIVFNGAGQIGKNWTSIPYNNPYGTPGGFCNQTGLTTGLVKASITLLNETSGAFVTCTCGGTCNTAPALIAGKGMQIVQPSTTGAPSSIIIVGSHNTGLSITVPKAGAGQIGSFWFAVPYHTTAATANDLCLSSGLSTALPKATITRLNATTGAFTTVSCATTAAAALALVLGEHVQIREPNGPKTFIPAHF